MNPVREVLGSHLSIRASAAEVRQASAWMHQWCEEAGLPVAAVERLDVCLNEALANVIAHGGSGAAEAPIRLTLETHRGTAQSEVNLIVEDAGIAFDPRKAATLPRPPSLQFAEPGGLGIAMMTKAASRLDYRRDDGRNALTITVQWTKDQ